MKTNENEYVRLFDVGQRHDLIMGMTKTNIAGENPSDDIRKALAYSGRQFDVAYMKQVHGAEVKIVSPQASYFGTSYKGEQRAGVGCTKIGRLQSVHQCDGIFTKSKNIVLIVKTADCLPLVFINEKDGIVGVVHMGWRSAKDGILENIPYDLSNFTVIAGVAMRRCCYAVGKEFADYSRIAPYLLKKDEETCFDPLKFAKDALVKKGLRPDRFIDAGECSYCSPEKYHSHRRTKTTHRMLTFVVRW